MFTRLGRSPKISERLKPRCLGELERDDPSSKFTPTANRAFAGLKQEQARCEARILELQEKLDRSSWGTNQKWWVTVSRFLQDDYDLEHHQLLFHPSMWASAGFQMVGGGKKKNTLLDENYLWERWCQGKDMGVAQRGPTPTGIWALNKDQRTEQRQRWNEEWKQVFRSELSSRMKTLAGVQKELRDLRDSCASRVLGRATIIGCTTVAAVKKLSMIRQVSPTVSVHSTIIVIACFAPESQAICYRLCWWKKRARSWRRKCSLASAPVHASS
jgi:hypothetical protein